MPVVALLGGSFNPPHVAHLLVARYVLATAPVDEVWLLPTYRHALGKTLVPFAERVAMCELLAAAAGGGVRVSRFEEELAQRPDFVSSRTVHLLEALAVARPDVTPRLVIGTDILHERHQWLRWDDVVRLAPPIVVGRAGVMPPADWPGPAPALDMPGVSSTDLRARLARGEAPHGLLPAGVLGYIEARGLYRPTP